MDSSSAPEIAEICFTCPGHAHLAGKTHKQREGVRHVWVVDAMEADIVVPAGVEVWEIPFNRSGNLNGWECMDGMIAAFQRAFDGGASVVQKRDSDTEWGDDEIMANFGDAFAIFVHRGSGPRWGGLGCGYSIRAEALPIMREAVESRDFLDDRVPEDLFFSHALRKVSLVLPFNAGFFLRSTPPNMPKFKGVAWRNCGNRFNPVMSQDKYWRAWPEGMISKIKPPYEWDNSARVLG